MTGGRGGLDRETGAGGLRWGDRGDKLMLFVSESTLLRIIAVWYLVDSLIRRWIVVIGLVPDSSLF